MKVAVVGATGQVGAVMRRLLDERVDEHLTLDRRESGDVVDLLLGVQRGDLAAECGQGIHHRDRHAPEPGVVSRIEAGRTGADDEEVVVAAARLRSSHPSILPHH